MCVHHRLTRRKPVVQPDIKAVRGDPDYKLLANLADKVPDGVLFHRGKFVERSHVTTGNDEGMAFGHGKSIEERNCVLRLDQGAVALDGAEWTAGQYIRIRTTLLRPCGPPAAPVPFDARTPRGL